jgi:hypothetical protein
VCDGRISGGTWAISVDSGATNTIPATHRREGRCRSILRKIAAIHSRALSLFAFLALYGTECEERPGMFEFLYFYRRDKAIMKKINGCVVFLVTTFFLQGCGESFYNLATVSPGKTYKVRLTEKETEYSSQNLWPYKVFLTIEKNGHAIVSDSIIYTGDSMDARFGNMASETDWISDKVLRFANIKINAEQSHDWIEFHNDSGQTVPYVLIHWTVPNPNANDRFLLIDVQPNEKVRLQVISHAEGTADFSDISCLGRFEDGKELGIVGKRFKVVEKPKSPAKYFVTIKAGEALIESQDYQPLK